jgi:hypothetical protein
MITCLFKLCQWLTEIWCGARGHRWCGAPRKLQPLRGDRMTDAALYAAGAVMRANPGHLPTTDRTEGGGYVAACSCSWVDLISYADVDVACASQTVHLMFPDLVDEWSYRAVPR